MGRTHQLPLSRRRAPLVLCGLVALVLATACAADDGDGSGAASGPKEGYWEGLELEFVIRAGAIEELMILEQPCVDDACVATCDGHICKAVFHGEMDGSFDAGSSIIIKTTDATLEGFFTDSLHASGKLELRGGGGCCLRIGAWAAKWVAPLDGGPIGPTGPGTGKPGPIDWGGHSTGTLHPGPALGGWDLALEDGFADHQVKAYQQLNDLRAQLGAAPVGQDLAIAKAAQSHAQFYVQHKSEYTKSNLSPHFQDPSFGDGFTGKNHGQRMKAAGFSGPVGGEVMAFSGSVSGAINGWLATLYHRIPLIDPRSALMGFGMAQQGNARTEVMDFSPRGSKSDDPIIVYPWPGQDTVSRSWNGAESPQPKPPPSGYPSGPMITATLPFAGQFGDDHKLLGPDGSEIPHMWLTPANDPAMKTFANSSAALYPHKPLAADTTYTVHLPLQKNAEEHTLIWRFTTAAK